MNEKLLISYMHHLEWTSKIIMSWYYDRFLISYTISEFDFDT